MCLSHHSSEVLYVFSVKISNQKVMSFLAYCTGSHNASLLSGRRLYQLSITSSAKHSKKKVPYSGTTLFRAISPYQPHSGKIQLSSRTNEVVMTSRPAGLKGHFFSVNSLYVCQQQDKALTSASDFWIV